MRPNQAVACGMFTFTCLLGIYVHLWTLCIAYVNEGLSALIASSLLPGVASVFWIMDGYASTGVLWSNFCIACMLSLLCGALIVLLTLLPTTGCPLKLSALRIPFLPFFKND